LAFFLFVNFLIMWEKHTLDLNSYWKNNTNNSFGNLDIFIDYYKNKLLDLIDLPEEKIIELLELLHKKPVLWKIDFISNITNINNETTSYLINALKSKWTTKLSLLTKPLSIIQDEKNNVSKYYFNTETISIYIDNLKEFFKNINPYYRKYSMIKIEEFIKSKNNSWEKDLKELINKIYWIIEFPKDYIFLILKFLIENNIIEIDETNKILFTKKWTKYYSFYKNLTDENWFTEISWDLQKYIIELFKNNENISPVKIKNKILKDFWIELNLNDLKILKSKIDENPEKIDSLNNMWLEVLKSQKKYNIINNYYVFSIKTESLNWDKIIKDFQISIDEIDEIFYLFSEKWLNLSQNEVIEYKKLNPDIWHIIKWRLRLLKKSDLFWPYTMEFFWEDENFRAQKIQDITSRYTRDITRRDIDKWKSQESQKTIKKAQRIITSFEWIKEELFKILEKTRLDPKNFKLHEQLPEVNENEITFLFSDIHIWKQWQNYIEERLTHILNHIINSQENIINILINWDIFESLVQWWMHPWQTTSIDWKQSSPYETFMYAYNMFRDFIIEVAKHWKKIRLFWISWNHDRISENKSWDLERFWWMIFYTMLKQLNEYAENIKIDFWKWEWHNFQAQEMNFILHHWDNWQVNQMRKKPEKIIMEQSYLVRNIVNLIVMWDQHNLQIWNPGYNIFTVLVPALWWKWEFDTMLWISSNPWYLTIKTQKFNNWNNVMPIISNYILADELQTNHRQNQSTDIFEKI